MWEVFINTQANINIAIVYSFTGRFDAAKAIINYDWLLFYGTVYVYSIWDCYRQTVERNKLAVLADRLESPIPATRTALEGINFLDKQSPAAAAIWSLIMPGLGHLYTHRFFTGLFVLAWAVGFAYNSHLNKAIFYTLTGDFATAAAIADQEWLLFFPSLLGFAIYDAYASAVEHNQLFDTEQKRFLVRNYQNHGSRCGEKTRCSVFSTFEHSMNIELAISELMQHGIPKEQVVAVPLNKRVGGTALYDTMHRTDGISSFDGAAMLGTACMVLGTVYGFVWHWGPIIWGLIGLIAGGAAGFTADYIITKRNRKKAGQARKEEVILIVDCEKDQALVVEKIFWENAALGVAFVGRGSRG